jgi:hypothetical protein
MTLGEPVRREALVEALRAAGTAHHEYETRFLSGVRDEAWPGWYAAYLLGRLGDFTSPTDLSEWLRDAPYEGDWAEGAASWIVDRLGAS